MQYIRYRAETCIFLKLEIHSHLVRSTNSSTLRAGVKLLVLELIQVDSEIRYSYRVLGYNYNPGLGPNRILICSGPFHWLTLGVAPTALVLYSESKKKVGCVDFIFSNYFEGCKYSSLSIRFIASWQSANYWWNDDLLTPTFTVHEYN